MNVLQRGYRQELGTLVKRLSLSAGALAPSPERPPHRSQHSALALATCLSLSIGEDLTADPRHAGNGARNDRRREGAQDLGLSPKGSGTDLWAEEEALLRGHGASKGSGLRGRGWAEVKVLDFGPLIHQLHSGAQGCGLQKGCSWDRQGQGHGIVILGHLSDQAWESRRATVQGPEALGDISPCLTWPAATVESPWLPPSDSSWAFEPCGHQPTLRLVQRFRLRSAPEPLCFCPCWTGQEPARRPQSGPHLCRTHFTGLALHRRESHFHPRLGPSLSPSRERAAAYDSRAKREACRLDGDLGRGVHRLGGGGNSGGRSGLREDGRCGLQQRLGLEQRLGLGWWPGLGR